MFQNSINKSDENNILFYLKDLVNNRHIILLMSLCDYQRWLSKKYIKILKEYSNSLEFNQSKPIAHGKIKITSKSNNKNCEEVQVLQTEKTMKEKYKCVFF